MKISLKINMVAKIKEVILYMSSLILVIYLYFKFTNQVEIASSLALFWYGLSFAFMTALLHTLSQYIVFRITSKVILKAYAQKEKIAPIYITLPSLFELVADMLLLYAWSKLFLQAVIFKDLLTILTIVVLVRILNQTIDRYFIFLRKPKGGH